MITRLTFNLKENFLFVRVTDLRYAHESSISTSTGNAVEPNPWPLHCFIEVGVGFPSILEAYVDLHDAILRERLDPDKRLVNEIVFDYFDVSILLTTLILFL